MSDSLPGPADGQPPTAQELRLLAFQHRRRRRRIQQILGMAILFSGYAVLAVSPQTPTEWVLLRVVFGFFLLILGFSLSIFPMLTHFIRGDDGDD